MKSIGGKRITQLGVGLVLGGLLTSLAGCGPVGEDSAGESVSEATQRLGSSKPRVDISDFTGLTTMVSDGNYRLTANINAAGQTWTPMDFTGTFDGNGRTISNLTINVAGDAGFFRYLNQAIVKNVKLINVNVTGTWMVGAVAGFAQDSAVERIAVEGTITATSGFAAGGIFGEMSGGTLYRSYAKGSVNAAWFYAGGLAGFLAQGEIYESYAQMTVSPNTSDPSREVWAGGLVGGSFAANIHDVYAVGNVTGRGKVGGLVGYLNCDEFTPWLLYKGIYRGDVVDKNAPTGGWAGTVGGYTDCITRWENCVWDNQLDPSSNYIVHSTSQVGGSTDTLRSNTTPSGGIYGTGDGGFEDPPWNAGSSSQHHRLRNMPGPNIQPI